MGNFLREMHIITESLDNVNDSVEAGICVRSDDGVLQEFTAGTIDEPVFGVTVRPSAKTESVKVCRMGFAPVLTDEAVDVNDKLYVAANGKVSKSSANDAYFVGVAQTEKPAGEGIVNVYIDVFQGLY